MRGDEDKESPNITLVMSSSPSSDANKKATISTPPSSPNLNRVAPKKIQVGTPARHAERKGTFDKFDSFDDTQGSRDDDEKISSISLQEEVERLRTEVDFYRKKYEEMSQSKRQQHKGTTRPRRNSTGKHMSSPQRSSRVSSTIELPEMRTNPNSRTKQSSSKAASSPGPDNDYESDGMEHIDLEAHASGAGLHHRHSDPRHSHTTAPRTSQDDSYSSDDPSLLYDFNDDELNERNGLLSGQNGSARRRESSVPAEEQTFWQSIADRAGWLVGLLVLQSMSSFILARNEVLLQDHVIIVQFLTMLVGAGGNAGNQASVRVIRGLAIGSVTDQNQRQYLKREFHQGFILSLVIGVAGCIRAAIFLTPFMETIAITSSLFMIVIISVVLGALLPLGMRMVGIDPAHSSTTIQVIMVRFKF